MRLSRRLFLGQSLKFVSLSLVAPALFGDFARAAPARPDSARRVLVVLQLAGGNDGLNTVVPYKDPLYARYRPHLKIASSELVTLSDRLALHPALRPLEALWQKGHMAVVESVGYPNPDRSHFRSTEIWETAHLGPPRDGWIGRWLDGAPEARANPLCAVHIGDELSLDMYSSRTPVTSMEGVDDFTLRTYGPTGKSPAGALQSMYASLPGEGVAGVLRRRALDAFQTARALADLEAGYVSAAAYPPGDFGRQLRLAAALVQADLGVRVIHVSLGSFDTHSGQAVRHRQLLDQLARGVAAFYADLEAMGRSGDVLTMSYSEFGRRVAENASGGTDHGTAAPQFLFGPVKGGVYGGPPDLENLQDGDLRHEVDFRQLYATVLGGWLGVRPESVLRGSFAPLPLLG
jgi:uncharacterized protein (DUF1501 family)